MGGQYSTDIAGDSAFLLIIGNVMPLEVGDGCPVCRCLWILPLGVGHQLVL